MMMLRTLTSFHRLKLFWGALLGLFWAQFCLLSGMEVEQSPSSLILQEGTSSTLRCNFSVTARNLQWFLQNPGGGLVNLFYIASGTKESGRLSATVDLKERYSTLSIMTAQLQDSATYFCAAHTGYQKLIFGTGTQLLIIPNIPDPKPAVYQLTNSKSNNMSVCLFTDFDSRMNTSEVKKPTAIGTTTTVLDMRSTGSKSNGILTWTSSGDSSCNETFSLNNSYFFSSDSSCNAKLVEENFRTDWDMNFQNLSVMALRILFLKLTGFNLLMTLRLWSS